MPSTRACRRRPPSGTGRCRPTTGFARPAAASKAALEQAGFSRRFAKTWAKRWRYGSRATKPGELVQVDHMTCSDGGVTPGNSRTRGSIAVCPVSKFMISRVYSRATAGNARRFLMDLVEAMPFAVLSIQVDGGSEFMAEFEAGCRELGIPLHVLPPRRPQWNGCGRSRLKSSAPTAPPGSSSGTATSAP